MKKAQIIAFAILGVLLFVGMMLLAFWYGEKKGYDLAWFEIEGEDPSLEAEALNRRIEIGMGSRGDLVAKFQRYYNQHRPGFTPALPETGVFDELTRKAADTLGLPTYFSPHDLV